MDGMWKGQVSTHGGGGGLQQGNGSSPGIKSAGTLTLDIPASGTGRISVAKYPVSGICHSSLSQPSVRGYDRYQRGQMCQMGLALKWHELETKEFTVLFF